NEAVIGWFTNEETRAEVFYGVSPAAPAITGPSRNTYLSKHVLVIPSLAPSTTYTVKARSTDISENATETETLTFQTLPSIASIIVDDEHPAFTVLEGTMSTGAFGRAGLDFINTH